MDIFNKELDDLTEEDLLEMERDPVNFESNQIEYKITFDGDTEELRRDVVQFANGTEPGYLIFGRSDSPIQVIGMEKGVIDPLKNILNNVLTTKIDPMLSPLPTYKVIPLSNGKYVFIIKILLKENGIYAIRLHENPSNKNYLKYEFVRRMDGSKQRMNIEAVVDLIESKSSGSKKILAVKFHPTVLRGDYPGELFIRLEAVNKTPRPITVTAYGLWLPEKEVQFVLPPNPLLCSMLPMKLEDGDQCYAMYPWSKFIKDMEEGAISFPIKVNAFFKTHDGRFESDEIKLQIPLSLR